MENQSNWYLGNLWRNHRPWPALGRGFNTGGNSAGQGANGFSFEGLGRAQSLQSPLPKPPCKNHWGKHLQIVPHLVGPLLPLMDGSLLCKVGVM